MYFRILAIIALFFITGCSNNPVSTTTQKQEITNLVKHNISIETFSWSNVFIYSQDNTELLYETQTNSSGGFVIDTQIIDQKIQTRNVTDKLVWVVITWWIYQEYSFEDWERFNKKILFLLPYESLTKDNGYSFSIINNVISEMVALSNDDTYERYNYLTKTINEVQKIWKSVNTIGDHYGTLEDYYKRVYLRIPLTEEYYDPKRDSERQTYFFAENIYPVRVEKTGSGIILHKYLKRNSVYYGTGERISDMTMLPNRYTDDEVLPVIWNEPIFFQECSDDDIGTCISAWRQTYPLEDLRPTWYTIFTEDGESSTITSGQLDALEESGQIEQVK